MNEMIEAPRAGLVLMTVEEARQCADAIKTDLGSARRRLLDLYEREGWRALGYDSWRDCAMAEFRQSQRYLYRQLRAAEIERELASGDPPSTADSGVWPIGQTVHGSVKTELPEAHLRELARLPDPQSRAEVWQAVTEQHGEQTTAADVRAAVDTKLGVQHPSPTPNPRPIRSTPTVDDAPDYDRQDEPPDEPWICDTCGSHCRGGESCATCEANARADEQDAEWSSHRGAPLVDKTLPILTDDDVVNAAGDEDGTYARAKLLAYYSDRYKAGRELILLDPNAVADVLDSNHRVSSRLFCQDMRRWCDQLDTAMSRGLRMVEPMEHNRG